MGITICIRDVELGPGLFNLQGSHSQITVISQSFTDQPGNLGIDKKVTPARILIAIYRWRQAVMGQ
ncbi:hypothetical protein TUM17576_55700 [Enterobacter hormaechei]|nr:hypothetical protein TUM17576_55700 [Enterobacter hormaechei]